MPQPGQQVEPQALTREQLGTLAELVAGKLAERQRTESERLIDVNELAARIGVSRRGAGGLVARGELPAGFLIGGVRRWTWPQVVSFLEARAGRRPRRGRGRYTRSQANGQPQAREDGQARAPRPPGPERPGRPRGGGR